MAEAGAAKALVREGENCWRCARAGRAAVLIDAARYFSVLRRVAAEARHSILIIGWDIDSRMPLHPDGEGEDDGLPLPLGEFLDALAGRRDGLEIYVLDWDFTMLYAPDREFLPIYNLGWRTHPRVHFHLDDCHPPGASHHQKIVVVDDAVAFVGGIDLTKNRWDTPEHAAGDKRRRSPDDKPYPPFHDTQMMVDGKAAAAVGELARRRWRRATGRDLPAPSGGGERAAWPDAVEPEFRDIDVAIARTEPRYEDDEPVREVKALYLDSIAAARRTVYFENQYFTAPSVGEAIAKRLADPDGPEFVVVSRCIGSSWLENNTMIVLRARMMRALKKADKHGRLAFYYPDQEGLEGENCIALHSKFTAVDDRFLRVGSSNLNNRSMGLDTECDLAFEAEREEDRKGVTHIRNCLVAEHLGVEPERVAKAIEEKGSLIRAIESLRGNSRTLTPIEDKIDPELDKLVPESDTVDPEHPIDPDRMVDDIVPRETRPQAGGRMVGAIVLVLVVAALAAAWRWGPLGEWMDMRTLEAAGAAIQRAPATPFWVLGAYVLASLLVMPITLIVLATAFIFGAWTAFAYAVAGSALGAGVTFGVGRLLGRGVVRRIAGSRLNSLSRRLGKGGIVAVIVIRMLPVAPFTVVNIVAGASHLRARDFLLGTVLGMAPGILAVTVFADRLTAVVLDPSPGQLATLAAVVITIAGVALGLRRWARRRADKRGGKQDGA